MKPKVQRTTRRIRLAAFLLIAGLAAVLSARMSTGCWAAPGGSTDRVGDRVVEEGATSTGTRIVAAVVVVLLVAAVLVVLARVGLWQQALVPSRMIRFFAWALAAVFVLETVAAFTWSREPEWWMYGPVSLVIGVLALAVAGSGRGWPRSHGSLPTH